MSPQYLAQLIDHGGLVHHGESKIVKVVIDEVQCVVPGREWGTIEIKRYMSGKVEGLSMMDYRG